MNIAHGEEDYDIVAKTCGYKNTKRKVTYSFVDSCPVFVGIKRK